MNITDIAKAMHKKYIRALNEIAGSSPNPQHGWNWLPHEEQLAWIAAAIEAVAQVAAMNACAQAVAKE